MSKAVGLATSLPLITICTVICMVLLALSAHIFDEWADGRQEAVSLMSQIAPFATLLFTLLAASVGLATMVMALVHGGSWTTAAKMASLSSNLISFALIVLALGFSSKTLRSRQFLGSRQLNNELKTICSLNIILAFFWLAYLSVLGVFKHEEPARAHQTGTAAPVGVTATSSKMDQERALAA